VEIGCGNGYFSLPAARIADTVYALDLDEMLLDELSHIADQQEIDGLVPLAGDARELDRHLPEPVTVCLIANTFHGIDDPDAFVHEVRNVLRPEGRFIVINWKPLPKAETTVAGEPRGPPTELRLSPAETRELVTESSGFESVGRTDLPPYHYALQFER
jgi:ubiquinone/menaquinone biosynthesis C-methylase UbiE